MSDQTYRAPVAGLYHVQVGVALPTGRFEMVKNEDKLWFQFWKPKMVSREIIKYVDITGPNNLQRLEKSESPTFTRKVES